MSKKILTRLMLLLLTKCPISLQRRLLLLPMKGLQQLSSTSSPSHREMHYPLLQFHNEILTIIRTSSLRLPTVLTLSHEAGRNRTSMVIPLQILDSIKKALTLMDHDPQIEDQQRLPISNQELVADIPREDLHPTDNIRVRKEVCRSILGQVQDLSNGVMINIEVTMGTEILEIQIDIDHPQCHRTHMATPDLKATIGQDRRTGFDLHLSKMVLSETLDSKAAFARRQCMVHNLLMAVQGDQVEGRQGGHRVVHQVVELDQLHLLRNHYRILMLYLIILHP